MAQYTVKDNLLIKEGAVVPFKQSPNIGGQLKPEYCIIHFTGSSSASSAIGWMSDKTAKVSAHLHLDREGNWYQLIPFNRVAWHAGKSEWDGKVGMNSHAIGIEISNNGSQDYTSDQMTALIEVCKVLKETYNLKEFTGHEDIAFKRKVDPGKKFNWYEFNKGVYGKLNTKKTTTFVNLRESWGTEFKALSVLAKGTEVIVISTTEDWSKVYVPSITKYGYVSSNYLA